MCILKILPNASYNGVLCEMKIKEKRYDLAAGILHERSKTGKTKIVSSTTK